MIYLSSPKLQFGVLIFMIDSYSRNEGNGEILKRAIIPKKRKTFKIVKVTTLTFRRWQAPPVLLYIAEMKGNSR